MELFNGFMTLQACGTVKVEGYLILYRIREANIRYQRKHDNACDCYFTSSSFIATYGTYSSNTRCSTMSTVIK